MIFPLEYRGILGSSGIAATPALELTKHKISKYNRCHWWEDGNATDKYNKS